MHENDYNWRCDPKFNGESRTIADIGSHWFDAIQFITGKNIAKVYVKSIKVHEKRKKFLNNKSTFKETEEGKFISVDIVTEDGAFILFELKDGTPGILTLSQVSSGYKNAMVISIDGENDSITWEQENPDKLIVRNRDKGTTIKFASAGKMTGDANIYTDYPAGHAVGWADSLKNSVKRFYESIKSPEIEKRYATFSDGDCIVKLTEACLKSASLDKWIEVEEV